MKGNLAGSVVLVASLVVLLLPATPARGQQPEDSLRGLPGVGVLVGPMRPEAEQDGLPRATLQTDVELQLRQAGIRVLTVDEWRASPAKACLILNVTTVKTSSGQYAYSIDISVGQWVRLNSGQSTIGRTWSSRSPVGLIGFRELSSVREVIKDGVNEFINAWLTVNPKK